MDDSSHQRSGDWYCHQASPLRVAATRTACRIAATLQSTCGCRFSDGFAILMYHRIAEESAGIAAPTMNVTPQQLRKQLTGLLSFGFECWPLSRLVAARREGRAIPANAFAITFDDGFENNHQNAWPILRELNLPATIFVATKYLDSEAPFPFDDWQFAGSSRVPASSWRPMSTRQCQELVDSGLVEIGAHTHSHEKFLDRSGEFRRDMKLCLEVLRSRFGIEQPTFAFPYGYKNAEMVEIAKQLGVACSCSTHARRVTPGASEYEWGRFWADRNDSATMLAAKMCWYTRIADFCRPLVSALAGVERGASRQGKESLVGELPGSRMGTSAP